MHTMKKLAVAMAMVMAAGAAEAEIVKGDIQPGELFVNVWDETAQQSYALDLGITTAGLLASPSQSLSFNLAGDANYSSFLSSPNPLVFNVVGYSNVLNDIPDIPGFGALVTSNDDVLGNSTFTNVWDVSQVINAGGKIGIHSQAVNAVESNATANGAGNGSGVATPGDGDAYFGANTFLSNLGGGLPFSDTAGVNTALAFWHLGTTDGSDATRALLDNVWTLSDTGTLTYAPSAVPVPAAVWLFGSGLVGLVGIARRKTSSPV